MVEAPTRWPRRRSSPWIRVEPQVCVSTSRRAPTSPGGRPRTSKPSPWQSTTGPEKSSVGGHRPRSSKNSYARCNSPVLQRLVELALYRRHSGRNAHQGLPAMESWKHGNTPGTTGPCLAGPAATLRPSAQERHTAFVTDRFPSRPCDACRAPQQLTDCSRGRCRPPSDPPTGHPSRERRCRFDSRTPRRTDNPGRPGPPGGSRCRAGTTLNPLRLPTDAPDCSRTAHGYRCPNHRALRCPGSRTTGRRCRSPRSCPTPLPADPAGMYAANCPAQQRRGPASWPSSSRRYALARRSLKASAARGPRHP
jgi:hypothetical protein